ncbi:hypothetical protein CC53_gp129 [Rhizobium phage vB_RleS_L338C]|uniref:hypothetical protein n=1 Tax=Rhizobium phage vB_RleS_L338C TaxID=1414737 RepID=UPI0003D7E27F|nr:hypothetical protein CC53_gp129 [Rhizobium phage vB_RleS_L338C]AHC30546.1 hypothetical protein L338C_129 [Rhizobium phage vB_RleS_L338C]QNH72177.1 hypothetical protein P11VFA_020 [Rhizobium phage P11VFA]
MPPLNKNAALLEAIRGDGEHGTIKEHRDLLINLRDGALKGGHFEWAVPLSHTIAYLSKLAEAAGVEV